MQLPMTVKREKRCKQCGFLYLNDDIEVAFRLKSANNYSHYFRPICRLCEQDNRTGKARQSRWKVKCRRARQGHARKLGKSVKELEEKYGWNIDRMAHEAEYHYGNGCTECGDSYDLMDGGFGDITIDIWDRRVEPAYGSNTRWICKTCNLAKGTLPPELWAKIKRLWRERAFFLERQRFVPKLVQLPLCLN